MNELEQVKKRIKQLSEHVERIEQEIKEKEEQEEEQEQQKSRHPKNGEGYWYIGKATSPWEVAVAMWTEWDDSSIDKYYWNFCHGSTDKSKVEWTIKHIELVNEIKKYTRPFKYGDSNWYIYRDAKADCDIKLSMISWWENNSEYDYFNCIEASDEIFEKYGDEYISKFLFKPLDGDYKTVMDWLKEWEENNDKPF